MASVKRINEVMDTEIDLTDENASQKGLSVARGEVEFRDVSFSYHQEAGEKVGDALKLAPEEPVTKLVRIRHLENMYANAPVVYTTLYVPVKLFPDMARTDFTETSFYEALDSRGLSVAHASRRLEVVMPPEEVAAGLEITAFEPVAFIVSRGYTGSGQAVEYTESYYPASRSSFRIEIDR